MRPGVVVVGLESHGCRPRPMERRVCLPVIAPLDGGRKGSPRPAAAASAARNGIDLGPRLGATASLGGLQSIAVARYPPLKVLGQVVVLPDREKRACRVSIGRLMDRMHATIDGHLRPPDGIQTTTALRSRSDCCQKHSIRGADRCRMSRLHSLRATWLAGWLAAA